jgi:hypothetical protein
MSTQSRRLVFLAISATTVALLAGPEAVSAQTQPASSPTANPDKPTDPALKGPTVGDRPGAKKTASGFGPDAVAKKTANHKHSGPLAMAAFMKSLDVLRAAPTPEAARLTSEEEARIKTIASDLESSTKAYMDAHKHEIDDLRAKLSPNDRNMLDQQLARGGPIRLSKAGFGGKHGVARQKGKAGNNASADQGSTSAQSKEDAAKTRSRLVEIYAGRPKAEDAQSKILGVLTPEQLTIMNTELAKHDEAPKVRKNAHGAKGKKA